MMTYRTREADTLEKIYLGSIISNIISSSSFEKKKIVQIAYMVVYYVLGFAAVYKRSVRLYSWFATVSLVGLIMELFLAYTNR